MQVQEELLKDPFKKAIPTNSRLLAYGRQSEKDNQEVESPGLTPVECAGVIGGAVTLVVVLIYCLFCYIRWRPCKNFISNLKSFSAYYGPPDKNRGKSRTGSTTKNTSKDAVASPPPDQLALLSTAV